MYEPAIAFHEVTTSHGTVFHDACVRGVNMRLIPADDNWHSIRVQFDTDFNRITLWLEKKMIWSYDEWPGEKSMLKKLSMLEVLDVLRNYIAASFD